MEGNGDVAAAEHHDDDASVPQSGDLKIQDEEEQGRSPDLRQSGDDTACPRSASARERKDGSAGVGGLRGGGRRLFDIIQQVQLANRANADEDGNSRSSRWRSIRDRFRRAGAAMTLAASGQAQPVSDPDLASAKKNASLGRTMSRSNSGRNPSSNPYPISDPELVASRGNTTRNRPSISVSVRNSEPSAVPPPSASVPPPEEKPGGVHHERSSVDSKADFDEQTEEAVEEEEAPAVEKEEAPAVSLMALLEQSDSWAGSEKGEEEGEEEGEGEDGGGEEAEADDDEEGAGDGMLYECGVCMVRRKGAPLIPCGHTFCRLCSRELRVSRGSCPLCTDYIFEILDIL